MTLLELSTVGLLAGGLVPAMFLASRGDEFDRLIGVLLAAPVAVLVLLVLAVASGQSSYLIVPFVTVVASFAGTLVFTRLLGTQRR